MFVVVGDPITPPALVLGGIERVDGSRGGDRALTPEGTTWAITGRTSGAPISTKPTA
jgi:hypothetical protein